MRAPRVTTLLVALLALTLPCSALLYATSGADGRWTSEERATLRSLSLSSLGALPADPSNRYADDGAAAAMGRRLFFDTRLSENGKVSCATCHAPAHDFQDGRPLDAQPRPVVGHPLGLGQPALGPVGVAQPAADEGV